MMVRCVILHARVLCGVCVLASWLAATATATAEAQDPATAPANAAQVESAASSSGASQPAADPIPAGHSLHGEAFNEGPRQAAYLMPGLGRSHFPITVREASAQAFFNQGIDQLHGFWYFEAERSFRQVAQIDPDCAAAYWGMAMANINNAQRAKAFIAQGYEKRAQASPREQLYIDALHRYYGDGEQKARAEALIIDLEKIVAEFPDDLEAKAFLAFQLWKNLDYGVPIGSRMAVDALLAQIFAVEPLHPAHHYEIHLWDKHQSERALESAARCGPALPGVAHMWHMPGHTYSELKRYDDAVWQMEASARVDHAYMQRDWVLPDQIHNFAHNNEWLIRNYVHVGRARDAIAVARNMVAMPRHPQYNTFAKSGSGKRGRERLFDALRQFELWQQLIELAQSPLLREPEGDSLPEIQRQRFLGEAYFRLPDVAAGQALLQKLRDDLSRLQAERESALATQRAADRLAGEQQLDQGKSSVAAVRTLARHQPNWFGLAAGQVWQAPSWEEAVLRTIQQRSDEKAKAAEQAVQQPLDEQLAALEKAIRELDGFAQAAAGNYAQAVSLLEPSGTELGLDVARCRVAAGETETALAAMRELVESHQNEAIPLAVYSELLWTAGQRDEALANFQKLRDLTDSMELDTPVFARLAPLAVAAGCPPDWRLHPSPPSDLGERPEFASLGPLLWSPPRAREWTLPDAERRPVALQEYSGRPLVLVFYLGHGCLHCVEQLQKFAAQADQFAAAKLELVAISTDSVDELQRSLDNFGAEALPIKLLSDEHHDVFRSYRAYDDFEDQPLHATLLIDATGRIRWIDIGFQPFMDVEFLLGESRRLLSLVE